MAKRLTDKLVKALTPPPTGNRITYDDEVTGFGLRVTAAGAKAFVLNYHLAGRERRYTIGSYPAWSVTAAREEAKELRRRIDRGRGSTRDAYRGPRRADRPRSLDRIRSQAPAHQAPPLGRRRSLDVEQLHSAAPWPNEGRPSHACRHRRAAC